MADIAPTAIDASSPKNGMLMLVLCLLFGVFGAHRFYADKTGTAVVQLLTFGGLGIWALIDFLFILFAEFTDAQGRKVDPWKDL
jgi:TM2 domain-containing membrane protein YozV